jgi:hypothetical protein
VTTMLPQTARARRGGWENLGTSHVDEADPVEEHPVPVETRDAAGFLRGRVSRLHLWSTTTLLLLAGVGCLQALQAYSRLELPAPLRHRSRQCC